MKQIQNVGPYFTIAACCEALGIASKTAVRYRAMKYRIPTKRIGGLDFIHLKRLRAVFEQEKEVVNPGDSRPSESKTQEAK